MIIIITQCVQIILLISARYCACVGTPATPRKKVDTPSFYSLYPQKLKSTSDSCCNVGRLDLVPILDRQPHVSS